MIPPWSLVAAATMRNALAVRTPIVAPGAGIRMLRWYSVLSAGQKRYRQRRSGDRRELARRQPFHAERGRDEQRDDEAHVGNRYHHTRFTCAQAQQQETSDEAHQRPGGDGIRKHFARGDSRLTADATVDDRGERPSRADVE